MVSVFEITYSVVLFFLEYFRGDLEWGTGGALSTSQFIALFTVLIGVGMVLVRRGAER